MPDQKDDLFHAMRGTAILATCIVQTLTESDPTYQERFLEKLGEAYAKERENTPSDSLREFELLSWTRELLTGFSIESGQGAPYLDD